MKLIKRVLFIQKIVLKEKMIYLGKHKGKMETSEILKKAAGRSQGEIIVEKPSWINTHANGGRWVSDCDCIPSQNSQHT